MQSPDWSRSDIVQTSVFRAAECLSNLSILRISSKLSFFFVMVEIKISDIFIIFKSIKFEYILEKEIEAGWQVSAPCKAILSIPRHKNKYI